MFFLDSILNLIALLVLLKWRDRSPELSRARISLLGTLRKTEGAQVRAWYFVALLSLLTLRPLLYWILGSALDWTPRISLGVISMPFRSDYFGRMFLFSFLNFGVILGIFYSFLLFLSVLNGRKSEDPIAATIRIQLGILEELPGFLKLLLPWIATLLFWCILHKPFVSLGLLPESKSLVHLLEQGAIIGLEVYLAAKYLLFGILLLHLLNSYIYFGPWPFWSFIDNSAKPVLRLFSWIPLRFGKVDLAPLAAMATILVVGSLASKALAKIYLHL